MLERGVRRFGQAALLWRLGSRAAKRPSMRETRSVRAWTSVRKSARSARTLARKAWLSARVSRRKVSSKPITVAPTARIPMSSGVTGRLLGGGGLCQRRPRDLNLIAVSGAKRAEALGMGLRHRDGSTDWACYRWRTGTRLCAALTTRHSACGPAQLIERRSKNPVSHSVVIGDRVISFSDDQPFG